MMSSMRSNFRWAAGLLLAVVTGAVLITGIGTPGGLSNLSSTGTGVATIGGNKITAAEIEQHVANRLEMAKKQNPSLDMAAFVKGGGFDSALNEYVSAKALEFYARAERMMISKLAIDKQIAAVPAFKGPTGEFDEEAFVRVLADQKLTPVQFRQELEGASLRQQLLVPVVGNARMGSGMVSPYAALMLETRSGSIGVVPSQLAGKIPEPTDAQINAHYALLRPMLMKPEQRVLKYVFFGPEKAPKATPTDAEVAAFYKANADKYAASETRTLSQVVLPDKAAAEAFAAKVKAGQSFDAVAKASGFSPADTAVGTKTKAAFAEAASEAAANAAFALPQGGLAGPVESDLGWHVVRVDAIQHSAAKSLADARAEIFGSLARQKADEAMADYVNKLEDDLAKGATIDEAAKAHGLTLAPTPLVGSDGAGADGKPWSMGEETFGLLKAGFAIAPGDEPVVQTVKTNERYLLVGVDRVVAAAPEPLAKVRDLVIADWKLRQGAAQARKIADAIVAQVTKGKSMAEAFAAAKMPTPEAVTARRIDLTKEKNVPEPVAMMFSMAKGKAKLLAAPDNRGWMVVLVTDVKPGNIAMQPALVEQSRGQIEQRLGDEYAQQLANAARKALGYKQNDKAIADIKRRLMGLAPSE